MTTRYYIAPDGPDVTEAQALDAALTSLCILRGTATLTQAKRHLEGIVAIARSMRSTEYVGKLSGTNKAIHVKVTED